MTPLTLQQIFLWSRDVHRQLAQELDKARAATGDERSGFLFDYLLEHQQRIAESMDQYQQDCAPELLETRVQHYLDNHLPELGELALGSLDGADMDTITGQVMDCHNQVIEVYRRLVEQIEVPEVAELADAMRELEEQETHLMAHQVNRMHDL